MRKPFLLLGWLLATGVAVAHPPPVIPDASIAVVLNGRPVPLDAAPRIVHHRVLVPIRGIFEQLGADVDYHASTHVVTISRGRNTVSMGVDAPLAFINRRQVHLSVPPTVFDDRVMVPLRFAGEALGARVSWNPVGLSVFITTRDYAVVEPQTPVVIAVPEPPAVEDPGLVYRVFYAPNAVRHGDNSTVQLQGSRSGTAQLGVAGQTVPMSEQAPGVYFGSFPASALDSDQRPLVHLKSEDGASTLQRVMRPIPLQGSWVAGQPIIARVETNGSEPLHPGQRLVVAVQGTPGARASFSLGRYIFPMVERRPGMYRGEYVVQPGDSAVDARIQVTLAGPDQQATVEVAPPANLVSP